MIEFLILPGYGNSGPKHWQSVWEKSDSAFRRVEQKDWENPQRADWVPALDAAVENSGKHVVLVAHSLACLLVAHWAALASPGNRAKILGAFLVAVTDTDGPAFPEAAKSFAPVPTMALPFSSIIVASSNDPYASPDFARACARAWGGGIVLIGDKGHINSDSGLGAWAEGRSLLDAFLTL